MYLEFYFVFKKTYLQLLHKLKLDSRDLSWIHAELLNFCISLNIMRPCNKKVHQGKKMLYM